MLLLQPTTNNFASSDEFINHADNNGPFHLFSGGKYSATSEYTTEIFSDFSDRQLTQLSAEMSYGSFSEHWEKDDDQYWESC